MTSYELHWYRWLRRQLEAELGVPVKVGRPRALTASEELRVFQEVMAAPRKRSKLVIARLVAETGASHSTIERILTEQVTAHGASGLRVFRKEHQNRLMDKLLAECVCV